VIDGDLPICMLKLRLFFFLGVLEGRRWVRREEWRGLYGWVRAGDSGDSDIVRLIGVVNGEVPRRESSITDVNAWATMLSA